MSAKVISIIGGLIVLAGVWSPNAMQFAADKYFPRQPPAVVNVVDGKLSVPAEARKELGAFYRDLAIVVSKSCADVKTTDALRSGYRSAVGVEQGVGNFPPGLGAFDQQVNAIFDSAIGKESKPLDSDTRAKFAEACRKIAADLGVQ